MYMHCMWNFKIEKSHSPRHIAVRKRYPMCMWFATFTSQLLTPFFFGTIDARTIIQLREPAPTLLGVFMPVSAEALCRVRV
jgi:hypothetical protein